MCDENLDFHLQLAVTVDCAWRVLYQFLFIHPFLVQVVGVLSRTWFRVTVPAAACGFGEALYPPPFLCSCEAFFMFRMKVAANWESARYSANQFVVEVIWRCSLADIDSWLNYVLY